MKTFLKRIFFAMAVCLGILLTVQAEDISHFPWDNSGALAEAVVCGEVYLSPVAETEVPAPKLTIDGEAASGWSKENPWWDSTQVADGWHTFVLTERNKTFEAKLLVLNDCAVHDGVVFADETWAADQVHVVRSPVQVPAGVTLTIAERTVVKFCDNASLTVDVGGTLVLGETSDLTYDFIHSATPWVEQSEVTHNGGTAWRSGAIDDYGWTSMELHFQGAGTISFWWKVSSESRGDYLYFYLDGKQKASLSGERDWEQKSWEVSGSGEHILRWEYIKNYWKSSGSDCGWVDEIVWTPAVAPTSPCFFTHLADDTAGGDTNWDGNKTAPAEKKYELVLNGEVTTVGVQADIRYAKSNQWFFPITAVNCDAGTQYAIAGQPVTVTADYTGTLNGYRLDWRSTPTGVCFSAVEGHPYSACFTMPNTAVMVACVVQKIVSTSAWSAWGTVDTRSTFGGQLLNGVRRVSRKAQKRDDNAYVELTDSKGEFVGEIDALNWDSSAVADGWYTATIYEGDQTYSAAVAVINSPDVAVHGGLLNSNETWEAEQVHVVQYVTRVPNGRTLTVASNAIVKVCPGAGFQVDEGGKLVLGDGCVITDIADDSAGGDTNMDATATSSPEDDDGTVFNLASENALESEGTPEIKVKAPVERTLSLLPGWNAMVFDFALDTDSTRALKQLNAMELDLEHQTYIQPDAFVPNTLYWFFATRLTTLKVKGRTEVEDLPETTLSQFTPYGNAYGIVPEGCEIYEWKDGLFQRFTDTHFLPGHGYFLRKRE